MGKPVDDLGSRFMIMNALDRLINRRYHQAMEELKILASLQAQKDKLDIIAEREKRSALNRQSRISGGLYELEKLVNKRLKDGLTAIDRRGKAYKIFRTVIEKAKLRRGLDTLDALIRLRQMNQN